MWSARAHETKCVCLGMKCTFTSGGGCKRWSPMTPKCTPTCLGVALMQEFQMIRNLVEKTNKHQIGPLRYHWKIFKM